MRKNLLTMKIIFSDISWSEYISWQFEDKKTLKQINLLIKDIESNGESKGIGNPEFLKYIKAWSRRIDNYNRLVYFVENKTINIVSCKGHYENF